MHRAVTLLVVGLALLPRPSLGQQSANDLAQTAANPIADLISLPLQWNHDRGLGEFDRSRSVLNV